MALATPRTLAVAALLLTACGGRSGLDAGDRSGSASSSGGFSGVETCPGVDTWIRLSVGGAEPILLTSVCTGPHWTWGQHETAGPLGFSTKTPTIGIIGCSTSDPESLGVTVDGAGIPAVTTYTDGLASYIDEEGTQWGYSAASATTFTVTKLEPTGGVIEGSFTSEVTAPKGDAMLALSGSFRVCHVTDAL